MSKDKKDLAWTKRTPTESGDYWVRKPLDTKSWFHTKRLVRVSIDEDGDWEEVYCAGSEQCDPLSGFEGADWYGPLTAPE